MMPEDVFGIVGSVLAGAFRVEAPVAEGGFGVVYRAYHTGFRAPVALKCLKIPEQLGPAQQRIFLGQFRAEAELLFRLSASISNIVRPLHVDAFVSTAGRFVPFIALEWLDGQTLDAIAAERREHTQALLLPELFELLTPVAQALDRAHRFQGADGEVSIVHCDLKPENIIVARVAGEQIVKVLDFGIAKARSVASQAAGRVSGAPLEPGPFTPAYGAPEQWLPKRFGETGPWTDVWGLALSMVEALSGHLVIDGDRSAMMATVLDPERRPTPRQEGVEVSAAVEAVFLRALALDPKDRFARVTEFWRELALALQSRSERAARPAPEAVIPDLEVRPSGSHVRSSVRVSAPPAEAMELEFDLPSAAVALELDAEQLADARRSIPGLSGYPSPERVPLASPAPPAPSPTSPAAPERVSSEPRVQVSSEPRVQVSSEPRIARSVPVGARLASPRPAASLAGPELASPLPAPQASRAPAGPAVVQRGLTRLQALFGQHTWPALALLGASVLVTLADQRYAAENSRVFTLGPLRAVWLAGLLMVAGLVALVYRFSRVRDDR
ncbi:MAG TPA: serine/threonine-protein kinase [Polyangiaceae bacterium]